MKKIYFLLFLIAIGCSREFDPYQVPSGILDLSKENTDTDVDRLLAMTENELDEWEKSRGFVSYRTVLKDAYKELEQATTEAELESFQTRYNHVLHLVDSIWTPTIDIAYYQIISDEHGFYREANLLNRIVGDYIVTSAVENYSLLKNLKTESLNKRNQDNRLKVVTFKSSSSSRIGREESGCSTFVKASYFRNERNCRNDREVVIQATSYMVKSSTYEGDWRQFRVKTEVLGYERVGTWCTWRQYVTTLRRQNTSYTIDGWSIVNGIPVRKPHTIVLTDDTIESSQLEDDRWIGAKVLNANVEPNAFTDLHMEGTSRGVAGVWAVIDCR